MNGSALDFVELAVLFELAGEDGVHTQGECVVQHVDQLRQRYCEIY